MEFSHQTNSLEKSVRKYQAKDERSKLVENMNVAWLSF
jgi:hypothetical protein